MSTKERRAYFQHSVFHDGHVSHDDAVGELGALVNFAAFADNTFLQILDVVLIFIHHRGRYVPVGAAVFAAGPKMSYWNEKLMKESGQRGNEGASGHRERAEPV
jgi:hypothetical protein